MDYYNDQTPFVIYSVKNNTGANASEWAMVHKLESLTPQSPLEAAFEQFHKQEPQEEDVISEEGNLSIPYENTISNQELWQFLDENTDVKDSIDDLHKYIPNGTAQQSMDSMLRTQKSADFQPVANHHTEDAFWEIC